MYFKKMSYPYNLWLLIFIVVPIGMVFYYSIAKNPEVFNLTNFSVDSYREILDGNYIEILLRSVKISALTTLICLLIGYPVAYIISKLSTNVRSTMIVLVIIPMWMNFLLRTYSWITILSSKGILNNILGIFGIGPFEMLYTEGAVLLGMVYNYMPFMVMPIYSVLVKMDPDLLEAASDLGAQKLTTFRKVVFPLSLPGVITGITMVFIPAISTFEISGLLGGNKNNMIGNVIEQQFRYTGDWGFGSAISMILMILILISLIFYKEEDEFVGI